MGFTLTELLIVIVIIGILMGIAVPSYTEYVTKGKRAQAHARLSQIAQLLERSYSDNGTYNSVSLPKLVIKPDAADDAIVYSGSGNEVGSAYTIVQAANPDTLNTFVLVATPLNWSDPQCGPLTLEHTGIKGTRSDGTTNDVPAKSGCW